MKKVLSVILVLLAVTSTAWAETETTEKRNAFEFTDLYATRLEEIGNLFSVEITDSMPMYYRVDYMKEFTGENEYCVQVPAGQLIVSVPDFYVVRYEGKMLSFMHTDIEQQKQLASAMAAYSALEYGGLDAYQNDQFAEISPSLYDKISKKAAIEFLDAYDKIFDSKKMTTRLMAKSGNRIIFISGEHYDYYMQYYCEVVDGRVVKFIDMVAEAK